MGSSQRLSGRSQPAWPLSAVTYHNWVRPVEVPRRCTGGWCRVAGPGFSTGGCPQCVGASRGRSPGIGLIEGAGRWGCDCWWRGRRRRRPRRLWMKRNATGQGSSLMVVTTAARVSAERPGVRAGNRARTEAAQSRRGWPPRQRSALPPDPGPAVSDAAATAAHAAEGIQLAMGRRRSPRRVRWHPGRWTRHGRTHAEGRRRCGGRRGQPTGSQPEAPGKQAARRHRSHPVRVAEGRQDSRQRPDKQPNTPRVPHRSALRPRGVR